MDIPRVDSLLRQMQDAQKSSPADSMSNTFWQLLSDTSQQGTEAGRAAEDFVSTGEGDLHKVQLDLAKADISFRFLVEVRNKLTEAYQEISRTSV